MRNDARSEDYEFEVRDFVLLDAQSARCRILLLAAGGRVIMMLLSPHGTDFHVTCIQTLESRHYATGLKVADSIHDEVN
jgi:hypothetical protein